MIRLGLKRVAGDVASGEEGPVLKDIYWWLAGKKTKIGAGLYVALLAAHQLGLGTTYDVSITYVANALMIIGLLDHAWRADSVSIPEEWKDLYHKLAAYGPITGLAVSGLVEILHQKYCGAGCPSWISTVDRFVMYASSLGLISTANAHQGPTYEGPNRRK